MVLRYIEGHPAGGAGCRSGRLALEFAPGTGGGKMAELPNALPPGWTTCVDLPLNAEDLERLGQSVRRQTPFGG